MSLVSTRALRTAGRAAVVRQPDAPFTQIELGQDDTLTSPLLDGFKVPVSALFER